jgi:hypothetical protein
MKSTSYKIRIRATVNGVEKTPSRIAWVNGSDECLVRKCYKEKDYIVIELIPDCVGDSCIEGWVHFDDACTDCDPIYFKRCFCSSDTDCGACEECILGVCQSECPVDFVCKNDKCIQCDDVIKCPDGQICKDGKCVCAPGTFYSNEYKRCVECDSTTVFNDKCKSCLGGHIVQVDCYGACDPATGVCVDCIKNSDCDINTDGRNCCDNKECKCCSGTVWNPTLNKCVEDCKDTKCPTCERCGPEGCEPIKCPAGFKCVEGECIEWGCKETTCSNGADCGKGCGCDNGKCVPCKILNCATNQCASTLGCECASNGICQGSDKCDTTYCDGFSPCLTDGCTCYEYYCVDCNNFSCTTGECAAQLGCKCSNGKCVDDPNGGSGGGDGCTDQFILSADCGAECKLKATLISGPCKCDPVKFEVKPTTANGKTTVNVEMYKGTAKYKEYKDAKTIGNNEMVTGQVMIFVTYTKPGAKTEQLTLEANIKDNVVQSVEIPERPGYTMSFTVQNKGIKITNNSCTDYDDEQIATYSAADILAGVVKENMSKDSTSDRRPLFTWYKNNVLIKKDFPKGSSGNYEDFIDDPKLATLGDNFIVKSECGCSTTTGLSNLEFCCLDVTIPTTNCGRGADLPAINLCNLVKEQADAVVEFTLSDNKKVTQTLGAASSKYNAPEGVSIKSGDVYLQVKGKALKQCSKPLNLGTITPPAPKIVPNCESNPTQVVVKISAPNGTTITKISSDKLNYSGTPIGPGGLEFTLNKTDVANGLPIKITYNNGCIVDATISSCPPAFVPTDPEGQFRPNVPSCDNPDPSGFIEFGLIGYKPSEQITIVITKKVNNQVSEIYRKSGTITDGGLFPNVSNIPYMGVGEYTISVIRADGSTLVSTYTIYDDDKIIRVQTSMQNTKCGVNKDSKLIVDVGVFLEGKDVKIIYTPGVGYPSSAQKQLTAAVGKDGKAVFDISSTGPGAYRVFLVEDSSYTLCGNDIIEIENEGATIDPKVSVSGCAGEALPVGFGLPTVGEGWSWDDIIIEGVGGTFDLSTRTFTPTKGETAYGLKFWAKNNCDKFIKPDSNVYISPKYPGDSQTVYFTNSIKQPLKYTANTFSTPCIGGMPSVTLKANSTYSVSIRNQQGQVTFLENDNGTFEKTLLTPGAYTLVIAKEGECPYEEAISIGSCDPVLNPDPIAITYTSACAANNQSVVPATVTVNTTNIPNTGTILWHTLSCTTGQIISTEEKTYNKTINNLNLVKSYDTSVQGKVCVMVEIRYGMNTKQISNPLQLIPSVHQLKELGEPCTIGLPCQCKNATCESTIEGNPTCGGVIVDPPCEPGGVNEYCDEGCPCAEGLDCNLNTGQCEPPCGCGEWTGTECASSGVSPDCLQFEGNCGCPGGIDPCECVQ